ncbi:fibrinogen-like YCDxxxxGGGW domain-containing protein [Aliagarivorans taiwanensis]|uniref:fibrinogen-like YCDxxxxGGGW domain-containing protein n=1 Tax=Aliagarivorans taiwanensis TaxID=561966 RepID=UPI00042A57D0|nr:fibrinogen-like YCDxxxxGGGW domain-containing protein [Aliagarivorans taiwanensis]
MGINSHQSYDFVLSQNAKTYSAEINEDMLLTGLQLGSGSPISFVISGMNGTSYFLGMAINEGDFFGSWFADNGQSGDWELINASAGPAVEYYSNCQAILAAGQSAGDGFYWIDPDGEDYGVDPFEVYCDMTTQGGGWTLFASHADGLNYIRIAEPVSPNTQGVLKNSRWQALRETIGDGIMLIDESQKISFVSKQTMDPSLPHNHITPWNTDTLMNSGSSNEMGYIWCATSSNFGCSGNYKGATGIQLAGEKYVNYHVYGASLRNDYTVKFDQWSYLDLIRSGDEQNELLYFLR